MQVVGLMNAAERAWRYARPKAEEINFNYDQCRYSSRMTDFAIEVYKDGEFVWRVYL